MTRTEIKQAILDGKTVNWENGLYIVILKGIEGEKDLYVKCTSNNSITYLQQGEEAKCFIQPELEPLDMDVYVSVWGVVQAKKDFPTEYEKWAKANHIGEGTDIFNQLADIIRPEPAPIDRMYNSDEWVQAQREEKGEPLEPKFGQSEYPTDPPEKVENETELMQLLNFCAGYIGGVFHPDDSFSNYTDVRGGEDLFSPENVAKMDALMEQAFDFCDDAGIDIYASAMDGAIVKTEI